MFAKKQLIRWNLFVLVSSLMVSALLLGDQEDVDLFEIKDYSLPYAPTNFFELQMFIATARANGEKISLVGAGKSQGGQTLCSFPAHRISLHNLDKLLFLDVEKREVTVQAGMSWQKLQQYLAPHGLSIASMQSYNDFSIAGSLSVNVHGQNPHIGPLIQTVKSFKLLLADGRLMTVSRTENPELFRLVLGGYGLFGIITEVTLQLTDDIVMKKKVVTIDANDLADYVMTYIKDNPAIEFYSARFSTGAFDLLEKVLVITYEKNDEQVPEQLVLQPTVKSAVQRNLLKIMGKIPRLKNYRAWLEKNFFEQSEEIISRNNFMNSSIESLPQESAHSYYILQEYFIPYHNLSRFLDGLRTLIQGYDVNLLNIKARHVHQYNE